MTLVSFEHIEIEECNEPLVDLSNYDFILEPAYFNAKLSLDSKMYIRKTIAEKLVMVQSRFDNLKFKIWDGWRSREVQGNIYLKFWNELKTEHPEWNEEKLKSEVGVFVTAPDNPNRVPPHSTGGAIDLTLVDSRNNEIDMGTVFDHFGPEAATLYYEENQLNNQIRDNRKLLREAMLEEGFRMDKDEWWHFDYGNQLWAADLGKAKAIYGELFQSI